ncbi:putative Cyclohexanone monooxygenase [Seiridium cardinale]
MATDPSLMPSAPTNINAHYDEVWDLVRNSAVGFGFPESTIPMFSVSDEERQRIYQDTWDKGNGLRFMFGPSSDVTLSEETNKSAADFIKSKSKILETVKGRESARKLNRHGSVRTTTDL